MGGEDEKQIFCSVLHVSLIVATIFFRRYEFISRYSEKKWQVKVSVRLEAHKMLYWNMVAMYWTFQMLQLIY